MGPALYNDIMSISPDKLFPILAGYSTEGGGIIPCNEAFENYNESSNRLIENVLIILFLAICLIILKIIIK